MQGRYIRQEVLKGFGPEGQEKLKNASVLVVGAGGLGIPVLQYLNSMGTGMIGIVDGDRVSLSNLHRQVLYGEQDVGKLKTEVVSDGLRSQNSGTEIRTYTTFLNVENALEIISGFDLVVDATDNFPTRYLINDACVIMGKPLIYGALHGFEGQVSVFNYGYGPTYRCLFPDIPPAGQIPDCNTHGVLGILPGIIGNLQALEAVKVLCGIGIPLSGQLLIFDAWSQEYRKIRFPAVPENRRIVRLKEQYGNTSCSGQNILCSDFDALLRKDVQIIDVRTPAEFHIFHFDSSINIPVADLEERMEEIGTNRPVCFVCQSGQRSEQALQIFKARPEVEMYHLEGGIQAYSEQMKKTI